MNQKIRLIIAAIVTLVLVATATTVWAGSKEGSLGSKIHTGNGCNGDGIINMGDATFTMWVGDRIICDFTVTRNKVPNSHMGAAPDYTEYRSDGFTVSGGPKDGIGLLQVCFAYTPQDKAKNANIFGAASAESFILPSGVQGTPAMLCAITPVINGQFAMIGDETIEP